MAGPVRHDLVDQMVLALGMEAPHELGAALAALRDVQPDHPPEVLVQLDLVSDEVARDVAQADLVEPDRTGALHVAGARSRGGSASEDLAPLLDRAGHQR